MQQEVQVLQMPEREITEFHPKRIQEYECYDFVLREC